MTQKDIDNIISIICPNDEDFEKPIISPAYLKKELEVLALDQEPCEDAISRQAVKEQMIKYGFHAPDMTVTEFVEDLPPVNPTKTGHWTFVDKAHEHAHCSECDYGNVDLVGGRPHNYCPNCGAKMSENPTGSESEDKG